MPTAYTHMIEDIPEEKRPFTQEKMPPERVDEMVAYLVSDAATDVTGCTICVAGDEVGVVSNPEVTRLGVKDDGWSTNISMYGVTARRHMYEFGTTSEQLAETRVAASQHGQYNEHAMYRDPVTVEDIIASQVVTDPLHLFDCCVISDGSGALIVASDDVRSRLDHECVEVLGHGESPSEDDGRNEVR